MHTIMKRQRATETAIMRALFDMRPGEVRTAGAVEGWDEMQGYPDGGAYGYGAYGVPGYDTVGVNWGQLANNVFNPFQHVQMLNNLVHGRNPFGQGITSPMPGGQMVRSPLQAPAQYMPPPPPMLPGPPMLPMGAYQALQPGPRRLLSYMGLGSLSWTNSDTETEKPMVAEPQAAFRGRRLVIAQAKSDGATGVLAVVSDPLTVSGMPQTPAPNVDAPVEMFEASTTYSMLDLQIATSATQITLGISVSAIPASGETVNVSAGLYGEWLR